MPAMPFLGPGELFLLAFVLVPFGLMLWALIECLLYESSEGNTKVVWVLVILLAPLLGPLLYLLLRRPRRRLELRR